MCLCSGVSPMTMPLMLLRILFLFVFEVTMADPAGVASGRVYSQYVRPRRVGNVVLPSAMAEEPSSSHVHKKSNVLYDAAIRAESAASDVAQARGSRSMAAAEKWSRVVRCFPGVSLASITAPNSGRSGAIGAVYEGSGKRPVRSYSGLSMPTWLGCVSSAGRVTRQNNFLYTPPSCVGELNAGVFGEKKWFSFASFGITSTLITNISDCFLPTVGTLPTQRQSRCVRLRSFAMKFSCGADPLSSTRFGINVLRVVLFQDMMCKRNSPYLPASPVLVQPSGAGGTLGLYNPEWVPERFRVYLDRTYVVKGNQSSFDVRTSTGSYDDDVVVKFPPGSDLIYAPLSTNSLPTSCDSGYLTMYIYTENQMYVDFQTRVTFDDAADVT